MWPFKEEKRDPKQQERDRLLLRAIVGFQFGDPPIPDTDIDELRRAVDNLVFIMTGIEAARGDNDWRGRIRQLDSRLTLMIEEYEIACGSPRIESS